MILQIILIILVSVILLDRLYYLIFTVTPTPTPHRNYKNLPILLFNDNGNVEMTSLMNVNTWKNNSALVWVNQPVKITNKKAFIGEALLVKYDDLSLIEYHLKPTEISKIIKAKIAMKNIIYIH